MIDSIINEIDKALKVLTVASYLERSRPDINFKNSDTLTPQEKKVTVNLCALITLVRYVRKHYIEDNFFLIKIIKFEKH